MLICSFDMASGRGQIHVLYDDANEAVVVKIDADDYEYEMRVGCFEDEAAAILDLANEVKRLQAIIKGK